jgi:hypothetical protein
MPCQFEVYTSPRWKMVVFRESDYSVLCWLYCGARWQMLQDMDYIEMSCIIYVMVGTYDQLEHNNIWVRIITTLGIVMPTVHYYLVFSIRFIYDPGFHLNQTSPHVLCIKEYPFYIWQSCDFSCHSALLIPVNKQATSDYLIANPRNFGNPSNLPQYGVGFIFSRTCKFAVTYSIVTWS